MANVKLVEVGLRGGSLPVWLQPGDPPTLMFLHYWGGSHRTFDQVIDRLASGCAVVSYDQRGWGESRHLPGPYGISDLADDVLCILEELDIDPYVLVGRSMGGKTAQLVASQRPEGLAALALTAPSPPLPTADAQMAESLMHIFDCGETVSDSIDRMLLENPLPAELRQQVIDDGLAANREAQLAWPQGGLLTDITDYVRAKSQIYGDIGTSEEELESAAVGKGTDRRLRSALTPAASSWHRPRLRPSVRPNPR